MLLDHYPQGWIPVERGAADTGGGGDRREGHGLTVLEEISARLLYFGQGLGGCQ
jgi:hypothetical protein